MQEEGCEQVSTSFTGCGKSISQWKDNSKISLHISNMSHAGSCSWLPKLPGYYANSVSWGLEPPRHPSGQHGLSWVCCAGEEEKQAFPRNYKAEWTWTRGPWTMINGQLFMATRDLTAYRKRRTMPKETAEHHRGTKAENFCKQVWEPFHISGTWGTGLVSSTESALAPSARLALGWELGPWPSSPFSPLLVHSVCGGFTLCYWLYRK